MAGNGVTRSVEHVEVEAAGFAEPIEAPRAKLVEGLDTSDRLHELEQMFNEVLPLLRAQLSEQRAALANVEEARSRDVERIRELETQLSRQGDLFESLRGQAAALAATFDEASR